MVNYDLIYFPKREWNNIRQKLRQKVICSTIRSCNELNKYKLNRIYKTPWNDLIKIIKVQRYSNCKNIPTWNKLDKGMKISVRFAERYGNSKWDFIIFKLV